MAGIKDIINAFNATAQTPPQRVDTYFKDAQLSESKNFKNYIDDHNKANAKTKAASNDHKDDETASENSATAENIYKNGATLSQLLCMDDGIFAPHMLAESPKPTEHDKYDEDGFLSEDTLDDLFDILGDDDGSDLDDLLKNYKRNFDKNGDKTNDKSITTPNPKFSESSPILTPPTDFQPILVKDLEAMLQRDCGIVKHDALALDGLDINSNTGGDQDHNENEGQNRQFQGESTRQNHIESTKKAEQTQKSQDQDKWELVKNIVSEFKRQLSGGFREIHIPLKSEKWGKLDLRFQFDKKGNVNAIFKTTSKDLMGALAETREEIESILTGADFSMDKIHVQFKYIGDL